MDSLEGYVMNKLPTESVLQFEGYEVNHLHFDMIKEPLVDKEFQIQPIFEVSLTNNPEGLYSVMLSLEIKGSDNNPLPFELKVIMTGKFTICMKSENDELKEALLRQNTVAIMFPFLRSIVASLTTAANITPLILPIVNLAEAFENESGCEHQT